MTRDEFTQVVTRIHELWRSPSFVRDWNEANQEIIFRKLSVFRVDEVLEQLGHHKYDNPDGREPKFSEIAAKLWAVRKARDAKGGGSGSSWVPPWPTIAAWADRKSDGDLAHLWQIVERTYSGTANVHDNLWPFVSSLDARSGACLSIAWAVEHNIALTFKRGSDEWHAVMMAYDDQCRAKSVAEYKGRSPAAKLQPYPQEVAVR